MYDSHCPQAPQSPRSLLIRINRTVWPSLSRERNPNFSNQSEFKPFPASDPRPRTPYIIFGVHFFRDFLDSRFTQELKRVCQSRFAQLQELARGVDSSPVPTRRAAKSIGHETTFDHDTSDLAVLTEAVHRFLSSLAHDLRMDRLAARAFTIKLKDHRFKIITRHRQFPKPTNHDPTMWRLIQPTVEGMVVPGLKYRLIGLSLSDFVPSTENLFDQKTSEAVAAMDRIIQKHGSTIIRWGRKPEK